MGGYCNYSYHLLSTIFTPVLHRHLIFTAALWLPPHWPCQTYPRAPGPWHRLVPWPEMCFSHIALSSVCSGLYTNSILSRGLPWLASRVSPPTPAPTSISPFATLLLSWAVITNILYSWLVLFIILTSLISTYITRAGIVSLLFL